MGEIKTSHIERFLDDRGVRPKRRNVLRGNLVNFFNWAIASGYATANPALAVERSIEDDAPVRVLTPAQTRELLHCAMNVDPRTVPYFTLALFCGIRPAEAMALAWDDINLEQRTVHVLAPKVQDPAESICEHPPQRSCVADALAGFCRAGSCGAVSSASSDRGFLSSGVKT